MLEQKELKLLRLNVNKTKMVKLCRSYFLYLKIKNLTISIFLKAVVFLNLSAVVMSFTYLFVLVK